MMINIHQAKTHFSMLIARALSGEEVIIARSGVPTIKLVPIEQVKPKRIPGRLKGKIWTADDFDAPLPEDILRSFEE